MLSSHNVLKKYSQNHGNVQTLNKIGVCSEKLKLLSFFNSIHVVSSKQSIFHISIFETLWIIHMKRYCKIANIVRNRLTKTNSKLQHKTVRVCCQKLGNFVPFLLPFRNLFLTKKSTFFTQITYSTA